MLAEAGPLQRFIADLLAIEGALVEPAEPEGLEALLPARLQQVLGPPEHCRLGFGASLPAPPAQGGAGDPAGLEPHGAPAGAAALRGQFCSGTAAFGLRRHGSPRVVGSTGLAPCVGCGKPYCRACHASCPRCGRRDAGAEIGGLFDG